MCPDGGWHSAHHFWFRGRIVSHDNQTVIEKLWGDGTIYRQIPDIGIPVVPVQVRKEQVPGRSGRAWLRSARPSWTLA